MSVVPCFYGGTAKLRSEISHPDEFVAVALQLQPYSANLLVPSRGSAV